MQIDHLPWWMKIYIYLWWWWWWWWLCSPFWPFNCLGSYQMVPITQPQPACRCQVSLVRRLVEVKADPSAPDPRYGSTASWLGWDAAGWVGVSCTCMMQYPRRIRYNLTDNINVVMLMGWIWSNYSDLTRPIFPKWWFSKGNPLISGKSRLVKYYNLARWIILYIGVTHLSIRLQVWTSITMSSWSTTDPASLCPDTRWKQLCGFEEF